MYVLLNKHTILHRTMQARIYIFFAQPCVYMKIIEFIRRCMQIL